MDRKTTAKLSPEELWIFERLQEKERVEAALKRLTAAKARIDKEITRRRNILLSLKDDIDTSVSEVKRGKKTLFSLEDVFAISPETRDLIANPAKALGK